MIDKDFKSKREALGLSQQDVALLIGVSRQTYNGYENDPDTMPLGKYQKLLKEIARLTKLKEAASGLGE